MTKKKIVCKMFSENGEFYDYLKLVGQVDTKFKIGHRETIRISDRLLAVSRETLDAGRSINSKDAVGKAIAILRDELSDYIEFKEWSAAADAWVTV